MSRRASSAMNPFGDEADEDNVTNKKNGSSGNSSSSNPFDNPDATNGVPKPLLSVAKSAPVDPFSNGPSSNNNSNPFDSDFGFKTETKEDTPIITGMDTNDDHQGFGPPSLVRSTTTPSATAHKQQQSSTTMGSAIRVSVPTVNVESLKGWLRKGGTKQENEHFPLEDDEDDEGEHAPKLIPEWPYDYYHVSQQRYYDSIDHVKKESLTERQQQDVSASYVTRPPDLDDIPKAVQGVSLVDFEATAEQRAIGIISTWIYDEGLMEELIISGENLVPTSASDHAFSANEGIELNIQGNVIEGSQKIDKEIDKLRASTERELSLINARLNDGVAASGSEVQELVNAVSATKGDLGKLRELCTYIAQGRNEARAALLAPYPRLKVAVHARRNLARCFRELDFFTQIPATCERLRDEMFSSEWTDEEWAILRNVCREHVELEVFLIEAEAGMKARIDDERTLDGTTGDGGGESSPLKNQGGRNAQLNSKSKSFLYKSGGGSYASVDRFLEEHVRIVWELGDEIRLRVLSGVGMTFDLALNNPAGMVALVEAVEFYEAAGEEFKANYGSETFGDDRLHFTDMRRGALEHIAKDFEVRGLEVFQEVQQMAADAADEDQATANFNAVLRASNNLTNQMDFVTHQMAPCFPKYWALEALWTSVVADVCSQQILGQIGGRDGQRLPDLTVTQLLDVVAWIESFREKIEDAFPDLKDSVQSSTKTNAPKPSIESGASLLHGDRKEIDVERAKESVAWVSGVLWEVHRLAQDEFLVRTRAQAEEWLENVYSAEHAKTQNADGILTTSLCEDVYSLVGVQLRTIRERLTKRSDVLMLAVNVIFSYLRMKQLEGRDDFLTDLECCCAAANDFVRMSEQCEDILADLESRASLSKESLDTLAAQSNELLALYSSDAVYAAQRVYIYIFEPIEEQIGKALFSAEWEESLTHNELALTLVRTLEDYMGDLEIWLEDLMVRKVVDSLVIATINFYAKCLLAKADNKNAKESSFKDPQMAITRINGDIGVLRDYFETLVETFPALTRIIDNEFEILDTIVELMMIAAGTMNSDMAELVFVLQRKIKDTKVTTYMVGDIWHLVAPKDEKEVYEKLEEHDLTLKSMAPTGQDPIDARNTDPGLRFDMVIRDTVFKSKRKRPIKGAGGVGNLVGGMKIPWGQGGGQGGDNQQAEKQQQNEENEA